MRDLLCVGEMVIDFLPGSEPGSYLRKPGGAPANVAVAASRGGAVSAFCGRMGDDDFGRFLQDTLRENGVEICLPGLVKQAVTTMAFVTLDANGERSFTFARKPGADMFLTPSDVDGCGIADTRIIHAGSCSLSQPPASDATVHAMKLAHELGRLVSFDVNYRDLMWDGDMAAATDAVRAVLPYIDLLKISDEEAGMLGGEDAIPALMKEADIAVVIETLGSKGCRWFYGGETGTVPGIPSECVDSCGAGDAFWGNFIAALVSSDVRRASDLDKEVILKAIKRGNIAGALCVRKKGAMESLPTAAEIERFIKDER